MLVGGYPTTHHHMLWVLDLRAHRWHALPLEPPVPPAAPPAAGTGAANGVSGVAELAGAGAEATTAAADAAAVPPAFVPVRHSAIVLRDALHVLCGGALCYSHGIVFGQCYSLDLRVVLRRLGGREGAQRRPGVPGAAEGPPAVGAAEQPAPTPLAAEGGPMVLLVGAVRGLRGCWLHASVGRWRIVGVKVLCDIKGAGD